MKYIQGGNTSAPECAAGARDDGQLLHGGGRGDQDAHGRGNESVAGLVARDDFFLDSHQDAALLLDARHRSQDCMVKVRAAHRACARPDPHQKAPDEVV